GVRREHPSREDAKDTLHGVEVDDPYRGLEDGTSERVKAWMTAEDALARRVLSAYPERARLAARLAELLYVEKVGVPARFGRRYFTSKRDGKSEKAIYYVREGRDGKDRVALDPNAASADGSVTFRAESPSYDGSRIAYRKSLNNADDATLYVRDLATGKDSTLDVIPGAKYAYAAWTPRGDGFYYVGVPVPGVVPQSELLAHAEVRFHKLGTDPKADVVVRPKGGDASRFTDARLSEDGRWLIVTLSRGWTQTDVFVQDLRKSGASAPVAGRPWVPVVEGVEAISAVDVYKDRLFIRTNDGAPNYRLMTVDAAKPGRAGWRSLVDERPPAGAAR
ncbi:S9 family peptidase, partial [bacterium]